MKIEDEIIKSTNKQEIMAAQKYIHAIENLSGSDFSSDCYFYYVVPDEHQKQVAEHFAKPDWLSYVRLPTFHDRLTFRKTVCNFEAKDSDDEELQDDEDLNTSAESSVSSNSGGSTESAGSDDTIETDASTKLEHMHKFMTELSVLLILLYLMFLFSVLTKLNWSDCDTNGYCQCVETDWRNSVTGSGSRS